VLSLADVGYLEDDKPASIVVGIESPLYREEGRKEPFDNEFSSTFDPGGGVRRPALIDRCLVVLLPSLVDVGAASDAKCQAKDFEPLELAKSADGESGCSCGVGRGFASFCCVGSGMGRGWLESKVSRTMAGLSSPSGHGSANT